MERDTTFLLDVLRGIAERGVSFFRRTEDLSSVSMLSLEDLSRALLSTRGEASGDALANEIVNRWAGLNSAERLDWFLMLADQFGADTEAFEAALSTWRADPSPLTLGKVHAASEPSRQELLRRINLATGGTGALVRMRCKLLGEIAENPVLATVDEDFRHLFGSWFNRGFLELRVIDWSSPAEILDKIIRYEAVHEIEDWDDLRRRLRPPDRRCFAFFHPQMPDEPLVFVEVALTCGIPAHINSLLAGDRDPIAADQADTAVFYSISNTQLGLTGVSFGNFLIKQVVRELVLELPNLGAFATLSPVPGFARWLSSRQERGLEGEAGSIDPDLYTALKTPDWHEDPDLRAKLHPQLETAIANYLLRAKLDNGSPADPVARFHLNNGASLERINYCGDVSTKGLRQANGFMVNYLYDPDAIERNHEHYANEGDIAATDAIRKLLPR